jgi:hypothetical protein
VGVCGTFWLALALLVAGAEQPPEPEAAQAAEAPAPESLFAEAFAPDVGPDDSRMCLERIVKESPDSEWADDALWVLGEAARQQGQPRRVAYYWQYLMAVHPEPHLEELTRSLPLYQRSGLPQVELYMRRTGQSYVRSEGRLREGNRELLNVKPFSPLPMLVWAELGKTYEHMGRLTLSRKAFARAQTSAPTGGQWRQNYAASARRIDAKLAALGKVQATADAEPRPVPAPAPLTGAPASASTATSRGSEALDAAETE